MSIPEIIAPIVTDRDRDWSLAQCPAWAVRSTGASPAGEIIDDGAPLDVAPVPRRRRDKDPLDWDWFVATQIEAFERYFAHDRMTRSGWSRLWRTRWFPKADPAKRAPKSAPHVPHPFWRRGTVGFAAACKAATRAERELFQRIGVAQVAPDDPRLDAILAAIQASEAAPLAAVPVVVATLPAPIVTIHARTPQWAAWRRHLLTTEGQQAVRLMERIGTWQVPATWPPETAAPDVELMPLGSWDIAWGTPEHEAWLAVLRRADPGEAQSADMAKRRFSRQSRWPRLLAPSDAHAFGASGAAMQPASAQTGGTP